MFHIIVLEAQSSLALKADTAKEAGRKITKADNHFTALNGIAVCFVLFGGFQTLFVAALSQIKRNGVFWIEIKVCTLTSIR